MIHFAQPWALLTLLALPVILILHSLRPRRRSIVISTNAIWREALRERQRGLGLQKLLKDVSLLLLLLLALLLAIALADPRWATLTTQRSDVVIVLDVSASMKTREEGGFGGATRFDTMQRAAAKIIDTLPQDGRALIMTSGRAPALKTGFETDRDHLHHALASVRATDEAGAPRAALQLALSLLRNVSQGRVYFFSDGAFDDNVDFQTPQIEYRFIGKPASNIAITRFDFRPEIGAIERFQVLVTVRNYTDEATSVPVTVMLDGRTLVEQTIELLAQERKTLVAPFRGRAEGQASASIAVEDDLEADNHAFAVIKTDERLEVLLVGGGNFYLESALEAMPNVHVSNIKNLSADEYAIENRRHDITVFDGVEPPPLGAGRFLLINTVAPDLPFSVVGGVAATSIAGQGISALVEGLDFGGIRIDAAKRLSVDSEVAGLQRLFWSNETDLALSLTESDRRVIYVGFKLSDSSFPLSTAFPIFLDESLRWLSPRESRHADTQTRAGESFVIQLPTHQLDLIVRTPSGDGLIFRVEEGRLVFDETHDAGIYRYDHVAGARHFAINLTDERESDINARLGIEQSGPNAGAADVSQVTIPLWPYLMLGVLLIIAAEWGVWCWRTGSA